MDVTGAFVRVRWTVPEEDWHEVDRAAIERLFGTAAEVKLEGRVIPVVRTRAAGISGEASIAAKIAVWARLTEAQPKPLLACLEALQTHAPEEIAANIIERSTGAQGAIPATAEVAANGQGGTTPAQNAGRGASGSLDPQEEHERLEVALAQGGEAHS